MNKSLPRCWLEKPPPLKVADPLTVYGYHWENSRILAEAGVAFWVEYQPWELGDFNEAISMQKLEKPVYKIKNPQKTSLSAFFCI